MITLNMVCVPQGIGMLRFGLVYGQIWSTDDNQHHEYSITMGDNEDVIHRGMLPKRYSAHKNPFRILADIIDDINSKATDDS